MVNSIEKNSCTGCRQCSNICPANAIEMVCDNEGFWYPNIDASKCTECDICTVKCPVLTPTTIIDRKTSPNVFAAWSKNIDIRNNSTSGGIFSELAQYVIAEGGCVAGARYASDFSVEHAMVFNGDDIALLRQSKYVQSNTRNIYKQVKTNLDAGRRTLFSGTPCQNAALASFLGKPYDNLIQCDFVCRGVISPKVYTKYLDMLNTSYKSEIRKITFKSKYYSWNRFGTRVEFHNDKVYIKDRYQDLYMVGYLEGNLYLRPSCHYCKFKGIPRNADITLGDFWGISKTHPELDQNKGTSIVMVNSEKGQGYFDHLGNRVFSKQCTIDEVRSGNVCLDKSPQIGKNREVFFKDLDKYGFKKLVIKYSSGSISRKLKLWLCNRELK